MNVTELLAAQRQYFTAGAAYPLATRLQNLARLRQVISQREPSIQQALQADLGKSSFESYMTEIAMVYSELSYMEQHLPALMNGEKVRTPLAQFPAKSYLLPQPYGVVLIMSPWNYPFLLTLGPLIDALAAGNTVILKPSAYSPTVSGLIARLLAEAFPPELVTVVEGGRIVNQSLLEQCYDRIFFTGSKAVGQLVLEKAAKHLTPVTLELGGKSPCIVEQSADLAMAARRIVFGKFLNLGQTCVAPDYLLVQRSVKEQFIPLLLQEIRSQFGEEPLKNPNYGKIINEKHLQRLLGLLQGERVLIGGQWEGLRLAPTILEAAMTSPVMGQEIFGPILPILTFDTIEEAVSLIQVNPTPLALYLFTASEQIKAHILHTVSFGGGCVNDTIIHLATSRMGFGGVGTSGMGSYHGKAGFDTFSHTKSIVEKRNWLDLPLRYQPYTPKKERLLRRFLK